MLVDYVRRNKRSRALQRCHSTREISVASVFLQKRCANGADGPRRISADFGGFRFAEDDFSSNHGTREPCLEKPRSWGRRTLPSDEPEIPVLCANWFHKAIRLSIERQ